MLLPSLYAYLAQFHRIRLRTQATRPWRNLLLSILCFSIWQIGPAQADPALEIPGDLAPYDCAANGCYLPGIIDLETSDRLLNSIRDWLERKGTIDWVFGDLDRYRRLAVWPKRKDTGLQEFLLIRGLVLAGGSWPFADIQHLYKAERIAEHNRAGLWRQPTFLIAANLPEQRQWRQRLGQFVILRSPAFAVGKGRQQHYINFGLDWRKDVSVSLDKKLVAFDLLEQQATGQQIETRGWLEQQNGPMLKLPDTRWLLINGAFPAFLSPRP